MNLSLQTPGFNAIFRN